MYTEWSAEFLGNAELPLEIRVAELSNSLENKSRYVWGKGNPQV